MSFLARWFAPYNFGRGLMKFHQQKYHDAVELFQRVIDSDPDSDKQGVYAAYLGRALLAINKNDEAHQALIKSYSIFEKNSFHSNDDNEKDLIIETLNAYFNTLKRNGEIEQAEKVKTNLSRIKAVL